MGWLTAEMSQMAGQFTFRETTVALAVGAKGVQLCEANPLRWSLMIGLSGANAATGLTAGVSLTASQVLGAGQQVSSGWDFTTNFRQDGTLACQAFFGSTTAGQQVLLDVLEVIAVQGEG